MISFKSTGSTYESADVWGFPGAIWGMRAAHESWDKSDSYWYDNSGEYVVGPKDLALMKNLAMAGDDHGKFLRCIHVQTYITAPIRWWVEMDTYKVGTVRLSTSLMHKVLNSEGPAFNTSDFSTDHIISRLAWDLFEDDIDKLNRICQNYREEYEAEVREGIDHSKSKQRWYEIQELVPRCYNYGSLLDLNYATLRKIAHSDRKNHKQDEWRVGFFDWMKTLPYADELIFS